MEINRTKEHMQDYLRVEIDPDATFKDILAHAKGMGGMVERQLATTFFDELCLIADSKASPSLHVVD
jgi:hypothetical protein